MRWISKEDLRLEELALQLRHKDIWFHCKAFFKAFPVSSMIMHSPTPDPHTIPPLFHKARGWDFSKMAVMGRDGKFLREIEMAWSQEWIPLLPTPFFQILSNTSTSLSPPNPHPHCSFCCTISLAEWVITPHLMCYFT